MTAAPLCEAAVVMADTAAPATSAPDVAPAQEKQAATAAASAMSEKGDAAPVTARDAQASVASPAPETGGGPSGSPTADASTTAVATTSGQAGSAGTANGATAAATGGSTANVSSKLNVKTKSKLALNPEASVFTPVRCSLPRPGGAVLQLCLSATCPLRRQARLRACPRRAQTRSRRRGRPPLWYWRTRVFGLLPASLLARCNIRRQLGSPATTAALQQLKGPASRPRGGASGEVASAFVTARQQWRRVCLELTQRLCAGSKR